MSSAARHGTGERTIVDATEPHAALLGAARRSARMHAVRANHLRSEVDVLRSEIDVLRNEIVQREAMLQRIKHSTSWRMTRPLRAGLMAVRAGLRGAIAVARGKPELLPAKGSDVSHWWHGHAVLPGAGTFDVDPAYLRTPRRAASEVLAPRVLIVAELSIPQCSKYRVWQKQEHLARLGFTATVVDWRQVWRCLGALQVHAKLILYRVPLTPEVRGLLKEAARLGVDTSWEVDDLIFDEALYVQNQNLTTLNADLRREVLSGVAGYRAGLLACGSAIASTRPLAEAMRAVGSGPVAVVENALDDETLRIAAALRATRRPHGAGTAVIAYGSGTKTHDVDFLEVADALAEVMQRRPAVRLRIMGELTLPPVLHAFGQRVECFGPADFRTYLARLAEADISIAPLERGVFNDAKSNIKFLEAAVLGLPSTCSPRACFRDVVTDGVNGLLADSPDAWLDALLRLVDDPALRGRLGEAALATALDRYAPEQIAIRQVMPLVGGLDRRPAVLRILVVNVYFAPQSYGGATVVAEELTRRMAARDDTEVVVFTTHQLPDHPPGALFRYEMDGVPVIAAKQPPPGDQVLDFDNPLMADVFRDVLAAVQPNVVHFHCVQQISASCADACGELGIPYVVTLHDAWWLCQRQFMVQADGRYCQQWDIDLNQCERCIPESASHLRDRFAALKATLRGAALLTAPSEFHRRLHVANGHAPDKVVLNRNGVEPPKTPRPPRAPGPLRFGYVGGNEAVKGAPVLRAALEGLTASDYELVLVDNTLRLGFSTWEAEAWKVAGRIRIVPAYTRAGMDDFFASIDVLLFPSQWKESFGLTVREALLRDVWVIATDAGGAAEDIVDGVNGTLIPMDGDPVPLRDAIAALCAGPGKLAAYTNPLKDRIALFDGQAEHMRHLLAAASGWH